jgi:DNA-binding NarL/FixJ family response regulator
MRDVNGIDLTRQVLERHPTLLVLMLSMYDNPEYVNRAMQSGARGYVLKDAPSTEIVSAIEAISAGQTFLSPAIADGCCARRRPPGALAA